MASLRDGSFDSEETVTVPLPPTLLPDAIVDELRTVVESPHVTPEDRSTARAMLNEHEEAKALEQQNSDIMTPALRARMKDFQQARDTQFSKGKHRVQFSANDSDPVAPTTKVTTASTEQQAQPDDVGSNSSQEQNKNKNQYGTYWWRKRFDKQQEAQFDEQGETLHEHPVYIGAGHPWL